jgi:hypothetical protein
MNIREISVVVSLLALSVFSIGCGSSSIAGGSAISQGQALSAITDIFTAMSDAITAPGSGLIRSPATQEVEVNRIRNARLTGTPILPSVAGANLIAAPKVVLPNTTLPSYTYKCPSGGTIVINGSFTGTATSSTIDIVATINSCGDDGFTMNGDPNITIYDTSTLSGNVFTDLTTITGGITVGSNSCSINETLSATFNDVTNAMTGSISGTVCGVSVNGTL